MKMAATDAKKCKSPAEFSSECLSYLHDSAKTLFSVQEYVLKANSKDPVPVGDITVTKRELDQMKKAFFHQLRTLPKKYYTECYKRKRRNKDPNKKSKPIPFYMSDQFVRFLKGAKFGPINPGKARGDDISKLVAYLINPNIKNNDVKHVASLGILVSLFSHYVRYNKLKDPNSGYYKVDDHMRKCFATTNFVFHGEDLSDLPVPDTVEAKRAEAISDTQENGARRDFIERLANHPHTVKIYDESKGFDHKATVMIVTLFRIPTFFLSEEDQARLKSKEVVDLLTKIRGKLTDITKYYKDRNDEEKKIRASKNRTKHVNRRPDSPRPVSPRN